MSYADVDGFTHGRFHAYDGLELAYQLQDRPGDLTICLTNGLGGSYKAWNPFVESLGGDHRLVTWDYRGLYRSDRPSDLSTLSVEHQCEDMIKLFDHLKVDQALLVGWSMGVQMNFEFYRRHPDRVLGLVQVNGTSGRPFDTAFRAGVLRQALPLRLQLDEDLDLTPQYPGLKRLRDEVDRPRLIAPEHVVIVFEDLREENNGDPLRALLAAHQLGQLIPVHVGHLDVQNGQRELVVQARDQRLVPAGGAHEVHVEVFQDSLKRDQVARFVIDEQNLRT